jgi:serine/threonine-protein kinase
MGAVYLGEHVKMGRKSAIKVMAAAMSQDPDAIARFNREAANASRISHPHVCQIYDFGETPDGVIYLAMEYIEGEALKDVIEKEGALSIARAASILNQAAGALQAAHDLGIVHRDIKPDNIMVVKGRDGSDVVKVVDFGIARAVGGDETGQKVTKTGLVVGTPEYMSPEQLSGDKLDGRSDIYSLALVLYRMLTGTLPFEADSAQEVMIKRLTDEPLPLDQARPDMTWPPKLQLVMNVALARNAGERYQTAAEFGRDTVDAVAGTGAPQTRVDVAHQGATQLMSHDDVKQATKHQEAAKRPAKVPAAAAAPAPIAAKRSMLVPVLGGGGVVALLAALAVIMVPKLKAPSTPADSNTTQFAHGIDSSKLATPTPGNSKSPGNTRTSPPRHDTTQTGNPPPRGAAPNWGDSLKAGNDAFDRDDFASARRLAQNTWNASGLNNDMRASAAMLMATSFGATGKIDEAVDWYRRAQPLVSGDRRARVDSAISMLGARP